MKQARKMVALALAVLAAAVALNIGALAAEPTPLEGKAGIEFTKGGTEIVDPDELDGVYSSDLHFGEWTVTQSAKSYDSLTNGLTVDEQYAGFAIFHSNAEKGWKVNVQISGFEIGDQATMKGFELTLLNEGVIYGDDSINAGPEPTAESGVTIFAALDGDFGAGKPIFHAADGNYGLYGSNWSGKLDVPANSAMSVGEAVAVMKWSVENAA